MTQHDALQSLIIFAPDWHHAIEYRTAYTAGNYEKDKYSIFTIPKDGTQEQVGYFPGPDLEELVTSAKNFIYLSRIEQTLTKQPVSILAASCP